MRKLLFVLVMSCRTADLQTDLGGDLSSSAKDLSSPAASGSVHCGAMDCSAPAQCCRAAPFGDGQCVQPGGSCGTADWACDDPGDCASGQVCCNATSGSSCQSEAQCAAMNGRRLCQAMTDCKSGEQCCGQGPSPSFYCGNVCPISRRAYKDDIHYLDEPSLRALHDQLQQLRLSTWRYKVDPDHQHLGFIIDDVGGGPAVAPDGEHVDLYGYVSMAVAALQVQAREIEALRAEVKALKARRK